MPPAPAPPAPADPEVDEQTGDAPEPETEIKVEAVENETVAADEASDETPVEETEDAPAEETEDAPVDETEDEDEDETPAEDAAAADEADSVAEDADDAQDAEAEAVDAPSDVDAELDEDSIDELDRTIVAPRREARVEWTLVGQSGTRVRLEPFAVVGRRPARPADLPAAQLVALPDPEKMLSKTHALIEVDDDGAWVTDLGSTNGTELVADGAGRECPADERIAVTSGARLQFGSVEIELVREEIE